MENKQIKNIIFAEYMNIININLSGVSFTRIAELLSIKYNFKITRIMLFRLLKKIKEDKIFLERDNIILVKSIMPLYSIGIADYSSSAVSGAQLIHKQFAKDIPTELIVTKSTISDMRTPQSRYFAKYFFNLYNLADEGLYSLTEISEQDLNDINNIKYNFSTMLQELIKKINQKYIESIW